MEQTPDHLQIFTIGHSSHPMGTFLWLLQNHGVNALVVWMELTAETPVEIKLDVP